MESCYTTHVDLQQAIFRLATQSWKALFDAHIVYVAGPDGDDETTFPSQGGTLVDAPDRASSPGPRNELTLESANVSKLLIGKDYWYCSLFEAV